MTSGLQVTMLVVGLVFWRASRCYNDVRYFVAERRQKMSAQV